jgi:protein-tyrosine phosphatase
LVEDAGLTDKIKCDSAGTIGYHAGEPADSRMKLHALKRGYKLISIARKFMINDFVKFDYILTMDDENYSNVLSLNFDDSFRNKVFRMVHFSSDQGIKEVPDPYYGGPQGFENVLDILEDACSNLLRHIRSEHNI